MQGKNKIKIPRAPQSETPISQENAHLLRGGESRAGVVPTAWRRGSREERERKTERFPPKQRQSNLPYSGKKTQGTKWICLSYSARKIYITYIFLHSLLTHSVSCEAAEI